VTEEANPNGSQRNIAGLYSSSRRILGMMPHPERAVDPRHGGTMVWRCSSLSSAACNSGKHRRQQRGRIMGSMTKSTS